MSIRIGLTYDLRDDYRASGGFSEEALAEFDSPETIAALESALRAIGLQTDRIGNLPALVRRLAAGDRWDLVFNIAEGLYGRSREAQVPALLEAYRIPVVFSDALTQAVGLDKAIAKRLVRDAGLPTAAFAVLDSDQQARDCELPWPVFVKPIAEGTGKGCELSSVVHTAAQLMTAAGALRTRFNQPALAEVYLTGREFTVGVVGNGDQAQAIGVMEIQLRQNAEPEIYSLSNKEMCEERVHYLLAGDPVATQAGRTALAAYKALGCRDAARIDLRCNSAGEPCFIEVNTIAGLHPTHSDLPILAHLAGINYQQLIARIVHAAMRRYGMDTEVLVHACAETALT
ncbi:MAG: hypothetical protein WBD34_13225 [Burkholderiaceae bacterium]